MITTIYKCDRCGHEQPHYEQMWDIAVICGHHSWSATHSEREKALWCRKCAETFHLLPPDRKPAAHVLPEKPTLEQLIREIIREELQQ